MATNDTILHFAFPSSDSDTRTFKIYHIIEGSNEVELYRFHHPMTGLSSGITTFHRQNLATEIFETAGQIEWASQYAATVYFGIEEVPVRDLRRAKKSSSRSRRFKAGGSEYKWKIAENGSDLFCVDSRGNVVTSWSQEQLILRVATRVGNILDRIVVTFFLNLWFKQLQRW